MTRIKQYDARHTRKIKHLYQLKTPKHSARHGYDDEGVSSVLGKDISFRYSRRFLDYWYTLDKD